MKMKGLNWAGRSFILPLVVVLLLLASVVKNGVADTSVSGSISSDTTWTKATSPYIVTGSIIVSSGVTLTIEPGVTVKFDSGKALQIDGTLIAKGTDSEKITFTRNSGEIWGYILFSNSSTDASYDSSGNYTSGSVLEYCVVEYAGGVSVSDNGAIRLNNAHPFINYCAIQNNEVSGIHAFNISGTLKISNSTITDNYSSSYGGGVYVYHTSGGITTITGNTIKGNTTTSSFGGSIYSYYGTVTITNNAISGNVSNYYGGGIYCNYGTVKIANNIISGNNTSGNSSYGGGLYCNSSPATITNNIISGNTTSSLGGGIYCTNQVTITNNTISGNSASNATAVYYNSSDRKYFEYNTITGNKATSNTNTYAVYVNTYPYINYNNIYSDSSSYELWFNKSQGSSNLDAENNWWGSSDDATVQDKIYDFVDDSTKAIVDYSPYATSIHTDCPISPPTGLTATKGEGQITLNWSGNSESDLSGYKVYWDTDSGYPYANSADVGNTTSYTITGLATGKYYVTVTAYDSNYISSTDDQSTVINENQTNGNESWYAEEKTVTVSDSTVISKPTVSTGSATNITSSSATLNGTVTANGASTTAWFQYGKVSGTYDSTSTTTSVSGSTETSVSIGISGLSSSATYYYRIAAQNNGGTSYGSETSFTTSVYKDTTAPSGSISIESGASYTISTTVTLSLSATDDTGVTGYYLSTSSSKPSASASGWTSVSSTASYNAKVSYTLNSGDGSKTIYVWYKDAAGNVSNSANDAITLDTTAPTITITSPTSSSTYTTTSSTISLSGSASDATSGVSSVTWSSDKGSSGTASGTTSWSISSITLTSGANVITVTATDGVNKTNTDSITITYSVPVSTPTSTPTPLASPTPTATKEWVKLIQNGTSNGGMAYAYDSNRNRGVIFGGSELSQNSNTYEWNGNSWTFVTSNGPSSRTSLAMTFDTIRGKCVLFGGWVKPDNYYGDTWTWDGTQWSQVSSTGPHARANQTMAFDSSRGKVVLFGGSYYQTIYGDTWEWNGTSWTQISSSGPSSRIYARMVYDEARGKVVLFGGQTTYNGTFLNDTWEWDGTSWQQVASTGPSARSYHAMAYDSDRQRIVLFGGGGYARAECFNDTWEWNGASWVQIDAYGPSTRIGHCLFYDKTLQAMILYGGYNNGIDYSTLGDTWKYSSTEITPTPTSSPTPKPTPSPTPTTSPVKGMVYGTVNDSYEDTLEGVAVTIEGEGISESTETDEDGYYEFQGLAAGDYTLTYEKEGYVTQTREIILEEGEERDLRTVTMPPMSTIYGYVFNVKEDPINKARLKLKGINTKFIETKYSDADGYFEFTGLEADTYLLFARKRGYLPKKLRIKLREGEEKDVGEITLRRKN